MQFLPFESENMGEPMASHESSKNLNVLLHNFGREIKLYLDNSD
jgi:hypothetical protein